MYNYLETYPKCCIFALVNDYRNRTITLFGCKYTKKIWERYKKGQEF